jgi:hypothetical protein
MGHAVDPVSPTPAGAEQYLTRNASLLRYVKPPAFTPLPLGEVKPSGWLLDWCRAADNGITGHADELDPLFKNGWLTDPKTNMARELMQPGDKPKGYVLEQSAYWIDGAVRLGHLLDDQALLAKCQVRFDAILKRVEAGQPPMNLNQDMWQKGEKWAHWPMAVMGRAMIAQFSATGDPRYLRALEKIYANYCSHNIDQKTFSLIQHDGRQLENIEVMFEAYRLGGNVQLRDEAIAALQSQSNEITERLAWHEADIVAGKIDKQFYGIKYGHGVTLNESSKLPAIGYLYTGNPDWLRFSEASYEDMEKNEMLPYGVTSAHEQLGGVGPFSATELCNTIDYAWSNIWLLRITGNPDYGDRVERDFFNAAPGGISPDFTRHVYMIYPNRIDRLHPEQPLQKPGRYTHPEFAPKQFPLCCTGNLSRELPNYVMHLWMSSSDGGLAATLYGPSETKTTVAGVKVALSTKTDYPFADTIAISVSPEQPVAFPLHLRVPAWCAKPVLAINGEPQTPEIEKGFILVKRTWKTGDMVQLTLSREPVVLAGVCVDQRPYASVFYGPLLFALQIPTVAGDLNTPQPGADFQYALTPGSTVSVVHHSMPSPWSWGAPPPLELAIKAVATDFGPDLGLSKTTVPWDSSKTKDLTLVPFGSTAYRVSMFGVTEATR